MIQKKALQNRWTKADDDIRMQIGALRAKTGMAMPQIAAKLDLCNTTMHKRFHSPATFTLLELRRLAAVCEDNGVDVASPLGRKEA